MILYQLRYYPWGTLVPTFKTLGIIDSGYLTYYAQGKWIFILGLLSSFIFILIASFKVKSSNKSWAVFLTRYLLVYLLFSMVVTNSMRSPTVIFALLFSLWFLSIHREQYAHRQMLSHFFNRYSNYPEAKIE